MGNTWAGDPSTRSQAPRAAGRWPGDRAISLGDPGGARQTHLPVQGPLVQLISSSDPAADLGGLLPGFEGELRWQDARQLLGGWAGRGQARRLSQAQPWAEQQRPVQQACVTRAHLAPAAPATSARPASRAVPLAPRGRAPVWARLRCLGRLRLRGPRRPSPVWCCRPPQGELCPPRPPGSQPHPQLRGPHRFPQAEPPQLLQAGLQPLLQGPLLLPHGVGQLLRGGHRAVGAYWGQGHVLRGAGPGWGCTRGLAVSRLSRLWAGCHGPMSQPQTSSSPAARRPVTARRTGRPASLVRGGAGCDPGSPLPIPPSTHGHCLPSLLLFLLSLTRTHTTHTSSLWSSVQTSPQWAHQLAPTRALAPHPNQIRFSSF